MQVAGLVSTASVVSNHGGGRTVDLTPYVAQLDTILDAGEGESLRVDLDEGDVYTTIRRHFQNAAEAANFPCALNFRKIVANGRPVALLVARGATPLEA